MTNAQRYIARLTDKLDITEGAAREMTAQRAEDARKSAQPVERAHSLTVEGPDGMLLALKQLGGTWPRNTVLAFPIK